MFCPKCGAQNLDDAKFCRACGADIRLVPQALSGQLSRAGDDEDHDEPDADGGALIERGARKLVFGIGYLLVFLLTMFYFREFWWLTFWFIFPAVSKISAGVGLLARARHEPRPLPGGSDAARLPAGATSALPEFHSNEVAARRTAELAPPASVTEGTTRLLEADDERAQR